MSLTNTRLPTTRTTIATSEVENTVYTGKNGGKRNKSGLSVAEVVVLVVVLLLVLTIVLAVIVYLKIRNRRNLRMTDAEANAEPSGSDLPLTGQDDERVSERYRTAHNMKKMTTSQFHLISFKHNYFHKAAEYMLHECILLSQLSFTTNFLIILAKRTTL